MAKLTYILVLLLTVTSCGMQKHNQLKNNTTEYQLQTAEKLRSYMEEKKYDEAVKLFSAKQQAFIKEIKKDDVKFQFWCTAWTFDQAKFERYTAKIKSGNAPFIYEDNEWKIDEK